MLRERTVYRYECDECGCESEERAAETDATCDAEDEGWSIGGQATLCPECANRTVCDQCGTKRGLTILFSEWHERWLIHDGKAWCPDHWHVECDECHTHESGHADTLENYGWRIGEHTLCPECAARQGKEER